MARSVPKLVLSPSRDIPFDKLVLSQANVRKVKSGVSIADLAKDIAHRTLLQSLNVRTMVDEDGNETGTFEVPAGGRRYLALALLVKQKTLAKNAPIPCVVKAANDPILAEEDSYAENTFREPLHPLDQFRGMQTMVDKGSDVESIAAHFMVTPAVVNQRLKLAKVSPTLHEIYAEDGMTLEQLMAFSVSDDHARQEQVWELLAHSYNKSAQLIRQKLTENTVRATDKRVRFIGADAYIEAGGGIMRDLFEADDGGWLTAPALLDRLVDEKLQAEGERIGAEGWKWVATAVDLPWAVTDGMREISGMPVPMTEKEQARSAALLEEVVALEDEYSDDPDIPAEIYERIDALNAEIGAFDERPLVFDPDEMARAGVFVSIEADGSLSIERGFVRAEDEPVIEVASAEADGETEGAGASGDEEVTSAPDAAVVGSMTEDDADSDEEVVKPLSDKLVAELTAWRTLALQDAFAQSPSTAFHAVLHAFVLDAFYPSSRESCLEVSARKVGFAFPPASLKESNFAKAITQRHVRWKQRLPESDKDLWEALQTFDSAEQAGLFAHCASLTVNAQFEVIGKYDTGRVSRSTVERRLEHSHVLARAVGLDMVSAGWRPTVGNYLGRVTKPRIVEAVVEALGEHKASLIDGYKKDRMAEEAERLLEDAGWLPEALRTPELDAAHSIVDVMAVEEPDVALPDFLGADEPTPANDDGEVDKPDHAIAA